MPRIAFGADDSTPLAAAIIPDLRARGWEVVCHGAEAGSRAGWAAIAEAVARDVAAGGVASGIACCYTGTGASIAANKVRGARAALCANPEVVRDARRWNDANVLCLSLAHTPLDQVPSILDAWLEPSSVDPEERASIDRLRAIEGS